MKEKILSKIELSERELDLFKSQKENFYVTDKLFYKDDSLYSIKIIYKNNAIVYQLKKDRKIILESKNNLVIKNKIERILEK